MSRAHFMHKNIDWDKILKTLCYNVEKPELLSKKQQVTRLYKSYLKLNFDNTIRNSLSEGRSYMREANRRGKEDFQAMLSLQRDSQEYNRIRMKYEQIINDNYDPSMLFFDNQEHSPNSQKVIIFSDEVN